MRHHFHRPSAVPVVQAELPASPLAPRQARVAVRRALASWGLAALASDAELMTSELVANAVEHGDGRAIGLTIRRFDGPGRRPGIACEVSDSSPVLPVARQAGPDDDRGRGLNIVAALATRSGIAASPEGKTAWFTLTGSTSPAHAARPSDPEPESEAGA